MENDINIPPEDDESDFRGFEIVLQRRVSFFSHEDEETSSMDGDNESEATANVPEDAALFNRDLPQLHQYLGETLEAVAGRVILDEGTTVTIPILSRPASVIPGQTFPLTVSDRTSMSMLRAAIKADHTFGVISNLRECEVLYGTTIEIDEYLNNGRSVSVKATARQRFKVLKIQRGECSYVCASVEILPEVNLRDPLKIIPSFGRFRQRKRKWCRWKEAQVTRWPSWVFDMYDPQLLVEKVHNELTHLKQSLTEDITMPTDPSTLSWWVARHGDSKIRSFLLKINSPIQRLRYELSCMSMEEKYNCSHCSVAVANQSDVIAMSREGAQQTYVNPTGALHDTLTFRKASNITLITQPSTEFSWFPGYSWSIAECSSCQHHIGWRFDATSPRLIPRRFWGLTRSSLSTKRSATRAALL